MQASEAKREMYEKEKVAEGQAQEVLRQRQAREAAEEQALVLFQELQNAWVDAGQLQAELEEEQAHSEELEVWIHVL